MLFSRRNFLTGMTAVGACGLTAHAADGAATDPCLSVFLSDPHQSGWRGGKQPTHMNAVFAKEIDRILAMRPLPARAVLFGDIALWKGRHDDYAMARKSLDRLTEAGIAVFVTTGNHDHRDVMFRYFPRQKELTPVPGRLVSVIDLGTCDLLLLDSLDENPQGEGFSNNVGGALDDAQWEWLQKEAPARKRPFLVGAHHAINDLGGRKARALLGPLDKFVGWIHGHDHTWSKETNLRRRNSRALFRTAVLPGSGYWGDIGHATMRTYADRAVLTLHQSDFYYPDPPRDGERRPPDYDAVVAENDGQTCTFFY